MDRDAVICAAGWLIMAAAWGASGHTVEGAVTLLGIPLWGIYGLLAAGQQQPGGDPS